MSQVFWMPSGDDAAPRMPPGLDEAWDEAWSAAHPDARRDGDARAEQPADARREGREGREAGALAGRQRELRPAQTVLRLLAMGLGSQRAYRDALAVVLDELRLPAGTLYTWREGDAGLVALATVSRDAHGGDDTVMAPLGDEIATDCVRERRTVLLAGPLAGLAAELADWRGGEPGALVARPLVLRGYAVGALALLTRPGQLDLSEREWALLTACADALAVAMGHEALRASELERVKAGVVDALSHELRTPLTSLLGYLEALADGDAGDLTEEQRDYLAIIDASARRLHRQVNDLLTLSRLNSGELRARAADDVAPREVVERALSAARERAAQRDLMLDASVEADLPAVCADPEVVRQALDQLLDNALKCAPPGGSVYVRLARTGGDVVVSVSNTGSYVGPEERGDLFTAFYRTRAAERDALQGVGLGLSIARMLVERVGGRIWVESDEAVGTTFCFTLPGARRSPAADASA